MNRHMNRQMDRQVDRAIDRQTDGQRELKKFMWLTLAYLFPVNAKRLFKLSPGGVNFTNIFYEQILRKNPFARKLQTQFVST
jgi:hypothetical protein